MKKLLSLLLVLVLAMSLFAGCGKDEEGTSDTGSATEEKKDDKKDDDKEEDMPSGDVETNEIYDVDADGHIVFPLKQTVTFTAFVHTRPNVDNFEENAMTKWVEDELNIKFEFVTATDNESQEKQNLLLATGDYPDLLMTTKLSAAQQALYGAQGTLLPLNDLIDKQGPRSQEIFEEQPEALKRITMPDGNIYNLPRINECYHCKSTQKLWIYQPWLDQLGFDMPTTTDEFYEVMKAFGTMDPNGNGEADEIPLAGALKGWETEVEAFLMNAFTYNATNQSGARRLHLDNGTVASNYTTEGWKEGLKYLQQLRVEGLLAPESFTQAGEGLKQMGENPDDVILGAFPGGYPGTGTDLSGDRWRDYVTVPPLEGPDGTRLLKYDPYGSVQPGFSITDTCEYPEIAMAMADFFYSRDFSLSNSVGEREVAFTYIEDDALKGINGEPAIWNELVPLAEQEPNGFWNQMANNYNPAWLRLGRYQEDPNNLEVVLYRETMEKYEPYYPSTDMLLPPLTLTEDQSADLLTYSTSIDEYVGQKIAEFVLTDVDIDAEWDSYLAELEGMGNDVMLSVYQEALDASQYAQ